ncbi:MAG: nucleotidyltransferase family protein [Sideroxyarcus sp.]
MPMRKQAVLKLLQAHKPEIVRRFVVQRLAVFGSTARDEAGDDSDVDVLVEFEGAPTFDRYMGLQAYLENLLGTGIDLVTPSAIRPRMRQSIEKELVDVA